MTEIVENLILKPFALYYKNLQGNINRADALTKHVGRENSTNTAMKARSDAHRLMMICLFP